MGLAALTLFDSPPEGEYTRERLAFVLTAASELCSSDDFVIRSQDTVTLPAAALTGVTGVCVLIAGDVVDSRGSMAAFDK